MSETAPAQNPMKYGGDPPDASDASISNPAEILRSPPTQAAPELTSDKVRSITQIGLFILALLYTCYFARPILLPLTIALLLNFLLRPVIKALKRWLHLPHAIGGGLIIIAFIAALVFSVYEIYRPITNYVENFPRLMHQAEGKLRELRKPVQKVSDVAAKVSSVTQLGGDNATPEVKIQKSPLSDGMLSSAQELVFDVVIIVILLFFLLAYGDLFLRKLIKVLPTLNDKKKALTIANEMEEKISVYLFTMTAINAGLGLVVGTSFYFLGMPSPVVWGFMVGFLNYIPYLGATVGITLATFVALVTFESLGHSLLIPAVYFTCQAIEGNFITPLVMGHRLTLNPVVIFVWLIFWGWLWGVPGALIAVPMLAAFKIFCDHIKPLSTIGEFLGY